MLRGRAERMHTFATPGEVEDVLRRLAAGAEPIVVELARQPGRKETRWAHLAGGLPEVPAAAAFPEPPAAGPARSAELAERLERLEARVEQLSASLSALLSRLGDA